MRSTGIPIAAAPSSLSRTAISRRATPLSRQIRTAKIDTTRTPSENQANDRCDWRLRPRKSGRVIRVEAGLGRPVHTVLSIPGTVQHGVARTASCMKMAKASVVTARNSPGIRSAGRPTITATTAVTAPAKSNRTGSGIELPRCAATSAPTATNPNWPSDTCPAHPVRTVRESAITA